jgi:alpha-mannosidase
VVPHTHWDREWYQTEARSRQRLVRLLDDLLERLDGDETLAFHLDGQLAIVDDYLSVRPDARPRLARLAETGRLALGPWYVLADELLAGDEPLVRNLLAGRRAAAALGGWLPVGYSPDAFGHPAALPTILAGFGIDTLLLWRGYAGGHDLFWWEAPDGARVLAHHLPPAGYEVGADLPTLASAAAHRWEVLRDVLEPRAARPVLLVMNGADHHALQPDLSEAVEALRTVAAGYEVEIGTLGRYFDLVKDLLGRAVVPGPEAGPDHSQTLEDGLTVERGELRWSYGYTWTLQGVHATRAGLKRRIAEGATLLSRWAEPQAALAVAGGGSDRRPLLEAAWRDHLRNLSHDVVAGTVADPVADDAAARARHVVEQARGVLEDALRDRLRQDADAAREAPERWEASLVVVNPSPFARAGVVEASVTVFRDDVIVGRPPPTRGTAEPPSVPELRLVAPNGRTVRTQILDSRPAFERLDSPTHYPDQDRVWAIRVAAWIDDVAPLGCLRLAVRAPAGQARRAAPSPSAAKPDEVAADLVRPMLESQRDDGDTYTFQPVPGDRAVRATWGKPRQIWQGPLLAATAIPFDVGGRAEGTLYLRTDAGSRLVRYVVEGQNRQGAHRLRVVIPIARCETALADMPYGPVTRPRVTVDPADYPREWPATTAPMHRYVSAGGRTIFARGLCEYELLDRAIAVTLLRSVGDLSRDDLPARRGHAAWPAPTPGARELGPFRAELAVAPFAVSERDAPAAWAAVERAAEEFHAPLAGCMVRWGIEVPPEAVGPELVGAGFAFKAMKPRDDGEGCVLRCVNLTAQSRTGAWRLPSPISRAFRARLDESVIQELRLSGGRTEVWFEASPREVVTILVED